MAGAALFRLLELLLVPLVPGLHFGLGHRQLGADGFHRQHDVLGLSLLRHLELLAVFVVELLCRAVGQLDLVQIAVQPEAEFHDLTLLGL